MGESVLSAITNSPQISLAEDNEGLFLTCVMITRWGYGEGARGAVFYVVTDMASVTAAQSAQAGTQRIPTAWEVGK